MWWNQFHLDSKPWLTVGDFNMTQTDSEAAGFLRLHGGAFVGKNSKGSRWTSDRQIDWGWCSPSNIAQYDGQHDQYDHVKISDHIGFWIILNKPVSPTKRGRVKPGPRWTVPSWMSQDDWIQQLETSWKQLVEPSDEYRLFVALSQRPYSQNDQDLVQRQWDHFQKCLHMCFIFTYRQLLTTPGLKPDQTDEVKARLKQNGLSSKGSLAQFQWVNEPGHQIGDSGPGEHTRRLRRKIARLYEIRRECLGSRYPSMSLLHKVWPHKSNFPTSCAELQTLTEQMISTTQLEITSLEDHMKSYRLTQWKTRLNDPSLKGIASWVKRKINKNTSADVVSNGRTVSNPQDVLDVIFQFWSHVWDDDQGDPHARADQLVQNFGPTQSQNWQPISSQELWKSVPEAHGSHGPDQWSGNEIRCIPHGAITAFHTCSLRWHFTGCVPQQFCESRQINIFKIHTIKNDGTISVADIRTNSVLSGWWRVYSSAWVKSQQLPSWSKTYLHPAVASGTGIQGTEILAQKLQGLYVSRPGCVASLDGSNAFDRMNPVTSTQAMLQLGIAPPLACMLQKICCQQYRFVEFDRQVYPQKLFAGKGMPQGDPLSLFLTAVCVSAGLRAISQIPEITENTSFHHLCYMDDRSFWCSTAAGAISMIQAWMTWSAQMGLRESPNKTQIISRNDAICSNH